MKKILLIVLLIGLSFSANAQEKEVDSMKKVVVARLAIKTESINDFIKSAQKVVEETVKEEGCVTYHLYKNTFSPENEFLFYEEYKNQEALDFHNNSNHLQEFFSKIAPILDGAPIITVY